jgi:hypothetical protein
MAAIAILFEDWLDILTKHICLRDSAWTASRESHNSPSNQDASGPRRYAIAKSHRAEEAATLHLWIHLVRKMDASF